MDADDLAYQIYNLYEEDSPVSKEIYKAVTDSRKADKFGGALLHLSYLYSSDFNALNVQNVFRQKHYFDIYPDLKDIELFLEGLYEIDLLEREDYVQYRPNGEAPLNNYKNSYSLEEHEKLLEARERARQQIEGPRGRAPKTF